MDVGVCLGEGSREDGDRLRDGCDLAGAYGGGGGGNRRGCCHEASTDGWMLIVGSADIKDVVERED